MTSAPEGRRAAPTAFRRRVTVAFVLVAAFTAGLLAVSTWLAMEESRYRRFEDRAEQAARLSFLAMPTPATPGNFEDRLDEFRRRGGFDAVVVSGDLVVSSSPHLGPEAVPAALAQAELEPGEFVYGETRIGGVSYLVLAGSPAEGSESYYFFFSTADVRASLADFRRIIVAASVIAVIGAGWFGHLVAGRVLRPVRAAADAAQSLAEGLLETRLRPESNDEFGVWAHSFNHMAEALSAKIEALRESQERERRFTADVAHELRTPLAAMVSAADLMALDIDQLPPEVQRPAALLVNDVHRLQSLVLELLELARLDAGDQTVHLEPLDTRAAVTAIVGSMGTGDPAITVDIPPGLEVQADRARFKRVMTNLLSNARRHGDGEVRVTARREDGRVAIDVIDHGPGIAESSLPRIFDRFYKVDASRSRDGSGLGLAIALEQARLQAGTLTAANRPEGGACFTFRLPAASGPATGRGRASSPCPDGPAVDGDAAVRPSEPNFRPG